MTPPADVTIVVITRERERDLARLAAPARAVPVVLVDNGSRDGSAQLAREHGATVVELAQPRRRRPHVGVQKATTPYIAFADDDSWWAPARWRGRPRCSTATRGWRCSPFAVSVLVRSRASVDTGCVEMAASQGSSPATLHGSAVSCAAAASPCRRRRSAPRRLYTAVGGFSERYGGGRWR
jgi:glycosyltransferase involved in cell wall biosynthesis